MQYSNMDLQRWQCLQVVATFKRIKKGNKWVPDKTTIVYNSAIVISQIPLAAYEYTIGGKSVIELLMSTYKKSTDKGSQIVSDPNASERVKANPRYILDLLLRIIYVSTETVAIIDRLPAFTKSVTERVGCAEAGE